MSTCAACLLPFVTSRRDARYCSGRCRQRHFRANEPRRAIRNTSWRDGFTAARVAGAAFWLSACGRIALPAYCPSCGEVRP